METSETIISHLIELRNRLIRAVLGMVIVFACLTPIANKLYTWLAQPMLDQLPAGGQMIATAVVTPFFVPLKVAMFAAFLISLPHTLYQLWAFIAPALYPHERRSFAPIVILSSFLFLSGMAFAYFLVFPVVFGFLIGAAPEGIAVMTDIESYLGFVMSLFLAFGISFEVPVAVLIIVKLGWVSIAQLRSSRSYVIVGAFIAGAILTPPDVISQLMLAIPLWILYEAGILAAEFSITHGRETKELNPL
jgi:sec-independent protein translocase protein TatC